MPVTSHAADVRLAARCRAGDLTAFEELYRVHSTRLYAVAYRMLGHAEDAEDMLQEIFLLAFRKLSSFKGDASLGTWLYRLGVNACLDRLRSKARRNDQQTEWLDDELPPARATTEAGGGVLHRLDLERALRELPAGCRAAFLLHDVEGFEHREIASMLGIAEGTSKSQVHKARMRLRGLLGRVVTGGSRA
ncbi:Sigma-W factor [Luteitalea pratensis]|jgi:RNA polymerase sigma-70 factor (ECF subfamily)|uniref:Sigma-W factor n=1 Tax=Luteitalea pratensis TaxID=1855912 RepID=A0A143PSA9_LUTPR|nr:sigma-70 family RNA polymerase sigma factor [Luteitalea pratensis]AMY11515.1 Sigma-W factor [Luteitalea pratensis]